MAIRKGGGPPIHNKNAAGPHKGGHGAKQGVLMQKHGATHNSGVLNTIKNNKGKIALVGLAAGAAGAAFAVHHYNESEANFNKHLGDVKSQMAADKAASDAAYNTEQSVARANAEARQAVVDRNAQLEAEAEYLSIIQQRAQQPQTGVFGFKRPGVEIDANGVSHTFLQRQLEKVGDKAGLNYYPKIGDSKL
jgi:hypothetical protein